MHGHFVSVCEASLTESLRHFVSSQSANNCGGSASPIVSETTAGENAGKPVALVVDDMVDVTDMLTVFLSMAGYEVVPAYSASAAIEVARARRFDVVISDIGMPQMNGYELAQALRAMPGYESVPLVAVTGFSMYDDRERSLSSGFNAHLTKPIDPNVLFQLIERLRS